MAKLKKSDYYQNSMSVFFFFFAVTNYLDANANIIDS